MIACWRAHAQRSGDMFEPLDGRMKHKGSRESCRQQRPLLLVSLQQASSSWNKLHGARLLAHHHAPALVYAAQCR